MLNKSSWTLQKVYSFHKLLIRDIKIISMMQMNMMNDEGLLNFDTRRHWLTNNRVANKYQISNHLNKGSLQRKNSKGYYSTIYITPLKIK